MRDARGEPLEVQIRTPKMHYIAEYGFAAHWRYKEKLGRQDVWLDRLVQWKKWVASEKLGIVDRKLRPSGSPGGSGGDAALAGLADRLGLESGSAGYAAPVVLMASASVPAAGSSAAAMSAVPLRSISAGDAVAAELLALAKDQADISSRARSSGSSSGSSPFAAAAAAASAADEKFAARFRMQPISEAEVDQHCASVLVSGPRGVSIAQLPARCTVAQLLGTKELSDQLRRLGSGGLSSTGVLSSLRSGLGLPATSSSCHMAVNGVVVMPGEADRVVLRSGDQLQLLEEPPLLPLLGLTAGDGGLGPVHHDMAERHSTSSLPAVMADAGETMQLFVPGQGEAMEVALQKKLSLNTGRVPARAAALAS